MLSKMTSRRAVCLASLSALSLALPVSSVGAAPSSQIAVVPAPTGAGARKAQQDAGAGQRAAQEDAGAYRVEFVDQVIDLSPMQSGEQRTGRFRLKNVGTANWLRNGPNPTRLGTSNPRDRSSVFFTPGQWSSPDRVAPVKEEVVRPGGVGTFEVVFTAPGQPGEYREYFQVVTDGVTWHNDLGLYLSLTVQANPYRVEFVDQYIDLSPMAPGERRTGTFRLRNAGMATWRRDGANPTRLGTSSPRDRLSQFYTAGDWASPNRVAVVKEATVAPGEVGTFDVVFTAPNTPGEYREYFNPVTDGVAWHNDLGLYLSLTVSNAAPASSWSTRAPMATARWGLGLATASNGRIYAVGGDNGAGAYYSIVEEYDTVANSWRVRAPMPTVRSSLGLAAASNGKIYAVGGTNGSSVLATVEEYDPTTNRWLARAPMPTARAGLGLAAAPNGRLYAVGGHDSRGGFFQTVEEYDPATNRWATRAPMPTARYGHGLATAGNGKIYAMGGANAATQRAVEEYDPLADRWTVKQPMIDPARYGLGMAAAPNGKLYVLGGANVGIYPYLDEYTPATDTWRWAVSSPIPTPRYYFGVATASDGRLFAVGGFNQQSYLTTTEAYTPPARR
jgi:N-acetylneuraminic acid mutarotase